MFKLFELAPGSQDKPAVGELCRGLLLHTDDPVIVLDRAYRVRFINLSAKRMLGDPKPSGTSPVAALDLLGRRDVLGEALAPLQAACEGAFAGAPMLPLRFAPAAGPSLGKVYRVRVTGLSRPPEPVQAVVLHGSDVTDLAEIEQRMREREREFRMLAENSPDNIIRYGLDMRAVYCNREIEERVPVTARRLLGRTPLEGAPVGIVGMDKYHAQLARTLATGERATVQLRVPARGGEMHVHHVAFAPEVDRDGKVSGAIAVGRDVTPLVNALERASAAELEFRTLAENAGDNIVRWDSGARMVYVNPAMARLLGRGPESLVGATVLEAAPAGDFDTVHAAVLEVMREGGSRLLELSWTPQAAQRRQHHQIRLVAERDGEGVVRTVLGIGRDITDAVEQREVIELLARHDPLTRLANRLALVERAPGLFAAAQRHGGHVGVMLLDIDGFKAINDGLGHGAGDELLCDVARRFAAALRADDLLVRLGGDEFVIVAPDVDKPAGMTRVADKLHAALAAPATIDGRTVRVTASIGIAVFPDDGSDIERLLSRADIAMYQAKRAGRARTEYYTETIGSAAQRRLELEQALREAVEGEQMQLHYQPLVRVEGDARLCSAEALLRWDHPRLGTIDPAEFVPLAEETGLIVPLGRWVFEQVARTARRWNVGRAQPFRVAVNVSPRQLADPAFPGWVERALRAAGTQPQWLTFEITESAFAEDSPAIRHALERLRVQGLSIALDDFGTGYSALEYLARFPVDELKMDRSFVQATGDGERHRELCRAFIAMAGALRLTLTAEGVETDAQAAFLRRAGCSRMQGWHFAHAMPAARFEAEWLGRGLAS